MEESAIKLMQSVPDDALTRFAGSLQAQLVDSMNRRQATPADPALAADAPPPFTGSRARALLRAADVVDDVTLQALGRRVTGPTGARLALFDLLHEADLAQSEMVRAAAAAATEMAAAPTENRAVAWLSLAVAAFAWKSQYPLHQLDPASPPAAYSPAGQVLKRAAFFVRQQVQRSATERDKLARRLAFTGASTGGAGSAAGGAIPPLPPHFRPPVPVRYPEMAREILQVQPEEAPPPDPPPARGEAITIEPDEVARPPETAVRRGAPIRITEEQVRPEAPPQPRRPAASRVVTPPATTAPAAGFADSVRQLFGRSREPLKSTRLRVIVTDHPEGSGLYGLQVKITCRGVRSFVAGTTDREGRFLAELPVPADGGLTYDVEVAWPRDLDGGAEQKSVTLHADRTEFTLPFFRRFKPDAGA